MLPLNLAEATPADIQSLIDSEVSESLTLDFKEELPSPGTDDKREFLYDIAALANQAGGDLVYGLADRRGQDKQSTGIADRFAGLRLTNAQTEIARFSSLIRDGIAPRLSGVAMQHICCSDGDVLVVRVPHSRSRPHMVTFGGVNKFLGRAPTGKYPMSVDEIRRAFSEQRELGETIARWRSHRAELASSNGGPINFASDVTMLFHVIPASAFDREVLSQSWVVPQQDKLRIYVPHGATNFRYNGDGYLATAQINPKSGAYGYAQMFRSGIMEYADSNCLFTAPHSDSPLVLGQEIERQIVNCYEDAVARMRKDGRSGALFVGFSLVGVAGKRFFSNYRQMVGTQRPPIRESILTSPETFVDLSEPEDHPYQNTLLPLVDTMWQVAGWEGTPYKNGVVWEPFKDRD
jgi:hypothetical protein